MERRQVDAQSAEDWKGEAKASLCSEAMAIMDADRAASRKGGSAIVGGEAHGDLISHL
jgi:hypothetical protein